ENQPEQPAPDADTGAPLRLALDHGERPQEAGEALRDAVDRREEADDGEAGAALVEDVVDRRGDLAPRRQGAIQEVGDLLAQRVGRLLAHEPLESSDHGGEEEQGREQAEDGPEGQAGGGVVEPVDLVAGRYVPEDGADRPAPAGPLTRSQPTRIAAACRGGDGRRSPGPFPTSIASREIVWWRRGSRSGRHATTRRR